MNRKHAGTLAAVFADPVSPSIAWADVEGLLLAIGCNLIEGSGSRVRSERHGVVAVFHRPHPAREAKRYQFRDMREYLSKIGVEP